ASHPDFRPVQYNTAGVAEAPVGGTITTSRNAPLYRQGPDGNMVLVNPADGGNPAIRTPRPPLRNNVSTARAKQAPILTAELLRAGQAEMILEPAIVVSGIVMDSSGKPVSKADLVFQRRTPALERKYLKTDNEGRFRLTTAEGGDAAMIVLRDGQTPKYHLLNIEPGMKPLEIRLAPPRVLRGRVMDRQQNPVPAARLRLEEWMGMDGLLHFETLTDKDGGFSWTGAPPDQVTFFISKSNYFNMRHSISGSSEDMVIYLNRPNGIYGKVYDAETKKPIEAFTIIRGRKFNPSDERIQWERYDSERGAEGEYSIKLDPYYFQPEARLKVEAFGYVPQISPGFTSPGSYTNDFALKRGKGIEGVVELSDGTPAASAVVVLVEKDAYAYMDTPGTFRQGSSNGDFGRTDSKGHFEFSPKLEPDFVLVSHEAGFAEVQTGKLEKEKKIVLQPWNSLKGVMKLGDQPSPNTFVRLQNNYGYAGQAGQRGSALSLYLKADPDESGNFFFEKVPPGERMLYAEYKFKESNNGETPLSHGQFITAKPGSTNEAMIGGDGRKVTGYVKVVGGEQGDVDWRRDVHRLTRIGPDLQAQKKTDGNYVLVFETNGTFRVDNVPPGHYTLNITANDPEEEYYRNKPMGNLSQEVVVPDEKGASVNKPFDLGTLELKIQPKVKVGKRVPEFEVKSFAGKSMKLDDFKGQLLLIYFYASTSYSTYDFQVLKELSTAYRGKLTVLGMNLDTRLETAEQFAQRNQITWPQAFLGEWSQTQVPALFGVAGYPVGVLVDKTGKLMARQLRSSRLRDAVRNALTGGEAVEATDDTGRLQRL
ncbi:MAG TPA: redoxin domain-containing protein, partial [Candidatus Saccharimonadales bacterium]|nr:redoxin domain-containing protein [Candidatus Saccharimonadales bacterium]